MVVFVVLAVIGIFAVLFLFARSTKTIDPYNNAPTPSTSAFGLQAQPLPSAPAQSTQQNSANQIVPADVVKDAKQATIKTEKGDIVIELYPQDAPMTVANFATLATKGYYNNLTFHRVEPGFVIQGGDPNGDGTGGVSIFGQTFQDELNPNTPSYQTGYKEGVVAMANRGPNTNGSQFFIMLADNDSLPKNYTIFGKVTQGLDVVKEIQKGDKMTSITVE